MVMSFLGDVTSCSLAYMWNCCFPLHSRQFNPETEGSKFLRNVNTTWRHFPKNANLMDPVSSESLWRWDFNACIDLCGQKGTSSTDWAQRSRFRLETETILSPKYCEFFIKNRTLDTVQKVNNCIIVSVMKTTNFTCQLSLFQPEDVVTKFLRNIYKYGVTPQDTFIL